MRESGEHREVRGYSDWKRGEERKGFRRGEGHTPNINRGLEVGPGHDLVAFSTWRVELNGNTQAADSHRSLGAKALDGLQETPSGHSAQFDLVLIQHTRSANDTPPIVETLHDRQPFSYRNDEFVGKDRVENLMDLPSAGLGRRGDRRGN